MNGNTSEKGAHILWEFWWNDWRGLEVIFKLKVTVRERDAIDVTKRDACSYDRICNVRVHAPQIHCLRKQFIPTGIWFQAIIGEAIHPKLSDSLFVLAFEKVSSET